MKECAGQREWPPEWEIFRDERTAVQITRLTNASCISENGGEKLDHRAAILSRVRAERN